MKRNEMIYVVEDDVFIRDGLLHLLKGEGYQVQAFGTIRECEEAVQRNEPELMILDVLLKDGNGFDYCRTIRQGYDFPILFLTCCDEEYNTVRGFESGADDYVTKPFRVKELLLRIKALLRRSAQIKNLQFNTSVMDQKPSVKPQVSKGELQIDLERHQVRVDGKNISLTPTEYMIFVYIYKHQGRVVARNELLYDIWDTKERYVDENTLNVHISALRKKLGRYGDKLETVRGFGYRFAG